MDLKVEYFTTTNLETLVDTCGESLKYITIEGLDVHEANVRPDTLLISCPNLIQLNFQGWIYMDDNWKPDLGTTISHSLTDLKLDFSNPDIFIDFNPIAFLRAAPKLQSLTLNVDHLRTVCSDIPNWIQEYCPDLTTLVLRQEFENDEQLPRMSSKVNTMSSLSSLMPIMTTAEERGHQKRKGLQHIYLHEYNYLELIDRTVQGIVSPLFDIDRSQLVSLDLGGSGMVCETTLTQLASSPMPSLKALQLIEYNGGVNNVTSSVLRTLFQPNTMPNLTHLTFYFLQEVDGSVLEAIASNLNYLEELVLYHCAYARGEGLLRFLRQMGEKTRKHHLRSLTIKEPQWTTITEGVMEILACETKGFIEHLEQLNMSAFLSITDGYADVERFLGAKQRRIINNKGRKMKRLDIFFVSNQLQGLVGIKNFRHSQVKQLLEKMDQVAAEWEYSVGTPDFDANVPGVNDIYDQVTNINYERN